jgi:transposase
MINKEVYVEMQLLDKHGWSLRRIAKELGCSVNTVRRHLKRKEEPKYERKVKKVEKLEPHKVYLCMRQEAAKPRWIPATVLYREIVGQGYEGGLSQLRRYLRLQRRDLMIAEPVIRFETPAGEQMQVDWVEFRTGADKLYAFCATLGYSRFSYVRFVTDMKVQTLIDCHEGAFRAFGGVVRVGLYDNMKTVVLERDTYGPGQHRLNSAFLDYAKHSGFVIKLCRPYRAKTKGKVERFNGYLRRSFYVPLVAQLKMSGLWLDVETANVEVTAWLEQTANSRVHGTTQIKPNERLIEERASLQPLAEPWRGDILKARPQKEMEPVDVQETKRPAVVVERLAKAVPEQHALAIYEQLLRQAMYEQGAQ